MDERILTHLRTALANPSAEFRHGQLQSIKSVLRSKRTLVVQRTGWGKSMVYFIAVKMLREQGKGPALLISPLLSLMRNQLEAAEGLGLHAETINSTNQEEWDDVLELIRQDKVDLLMISPERLANDSFRNTILANYASNISLFVIDEAHCISDWGHDFRPDYRRITRVLDILPGNIPVLATTATANDRVVQDVMTQLGENIELQRGSLLRKSLRLFNMFLPLQTQRMAWLVQNVPKLAGSGIIYTLTQRDAERVTEWLISNGINAASYHAGVLPDESQYEEIASFYNLSSEDFSNLNEREIGTYFKNYLEQMLIENKLKILVATVALGMGFDKADIGFVIHFQRPGSVVHYYQQVGRAGRAIENAYGILMHGDEDDEIIDFFIDNAFPPHLHIEQILQALKESVEGLSIYELQNKLNLRYGQIEKTLKYLSIESPSPILKLKSKWRLTPASESYLLDEEYIQSIIAIRRNEQREMQKYMSESSCLMKFLQISLDDPNAEDCGRCMNCDPSTFKFAHPNDDLINKAATFLRRNYLPIAPRKQWVPGAGIINADMKGQIKPEFSAEEGRALCLWRDAGWGELVYRGKYIDNRFSDELVDAVFEMLKLWNPMPKPIWITAVPSLERPHLVSDFALRLAEKSGLEFRESVMKIRSNQPQKSMVNSNMQLKNLNGVFQIEENKMMTEPCILIDDMVDSRWTFTVISYLLRKAGVENVYPLALAMNTQKQE